MKHSSYVTVELRKSLPVVAFYVTLKAYLLDTIEKIYFKHFIVKTHFSWNSVKSSVILFEPQLFIHGDSKRLYKKASNVKL